MFGIRYVRVPPTHYLFQYRHGRVIREGPGLSFFYHARATSLVSIPLARHEAPFIVEETTADFQVVSLQGQVTFRVAEPRKLAAIMDFTLARDGQTYESEDPEKLSQAVVQTVKLLARTQLERLPLERVLRHTDEILTAIRAGLAGAPEIGALGLEILALSILAIRPTPETARALEAGTRERLLRAADEAVYTRRNAAIEQERAIKENELDTEIALENKRRQIRETQVDAERAVQEKQHQLRLADLEGQTEREARRRDLVALSAQNARTDADARAHALGSVLQAFGGADPRIVHALTSAGMKADQLIAAAFQELAGKADRIGQLNVSPELLRELLAPKSAR